MLVIPIVSLVSMVVVGVFGGRRIGKESEDLGLSNQVDPRYFLRIGVNRLLLESLGRR